MDADWRIVVELLLAEDAASLEGTASVVLGEVAEISRSGRTVFAYARDAEHAIEAVERLRRLNETERREHRLRLERWNPNRQEWHDPHDPVDADSRGDHGRPLEPSEVDLEAVAREVRVRAPSSAEA